MRSIQVDLHLHSTSSDGTLSPADVVALVHKRGLQGLALTDHDTIDGSPEARRAAEAVGLDFVEGCEFSCDVEGADVHLLAYLFDDRHEELTRALTASKERRIERGREMVRRLNGLGVEIEFAEVVREATGGAVGRPHVARALVASHAVGSVEEAFARYLKQGAAAYVPKVSLTSADAIALVRRAGGVAVLAHPGLYRGDGMIERLAAQGLGGVEVWHPKHTRDQVRRFEDAAMALGLVPTGGSDFHGHPGGDVVPGTEGVSIEMLERLRAARA
jgi:predicted metal-dependent phosphoesterase TrpH